MKKLKEKLKELLGKLKKLKISLYATPFFLALMKARVYASTISTKEVEDATGNIENAVIKLAMPIGSVLVFVSIVIIALKMIVNSGNPNKRTESIGSLAWVVGVFMLLGLALIVSGIILSIATNGTGEMYGTTPAGSL